MTALFSDPKGQLETQGYLPGVPVLTTAEVQYFRDRLESFERRHPEHVRKLTSMSNYLAPWIVEMGRVPRLLDAYEEIYGENLVLKNLAWRVKKPDGRTFAGWHQDHIYLGRYNPRAVIGVLALSECSAETGCLRVVAGSHKWGVMPHQDFDDPTSILARGQQISTDFDKSTVVDLALRPGELAAFDTATIHGSAPNNGSDRRIMILVTVLPAHARRLDGQREKGTLVRGRDETGNFGVADLPVEECSPEALAAWQTAIETQRRMIFNGSAVDATEGYGGSRKIA